MYCSFCQQTCGGDGGLQVPCGDGGGRAGMGETGEPAVAVGDGWAKMPISLPKSCFRALKKNSIKQAKTLYQTFKSLYQSPIFLFQMLKSRYQKA